PGRGKYKDFAAISVGQRKLVFGTSVPMAFRPRKPSDCAISGARTPRRKVFIKSRGKSPKGSVDPSGDPLPTQLLRSQLSRRRSGYGIWLVMDDLAGGLANRVALHGASAPPTPKSPTPAKLLSLTHATSAKRARISCGALLVGRMTHLGIVTVS